MLREGDNDDTSEKMLDRHFQVDRGQNNLVS